MEKMGNSVSQGTDKSAVVWVFFLTNLSNFRCLQSFCQIWWVFTVHFPNNFKNAFLALAVLHMCSGGSGWDPLGLNHSFRIVWALLDALN